MDPIQRNALFVRIAMFLFGLTMYLLFVVVGLMQWRGEMGPRSSAPRSYLGIGLALVFATLCVVIPLLPGSWAPETSYQASKQSVAPVALVIVALFFAGFVYLATLEIVHTLQWLRAGRPRPPAPPPPISHPRARGAAPAQGAHARRSSRHRRRH